jgi:ATP-dependent exoDNAse (exonuclease V) beta subunit
MNRQKTDYGLVITDWKTNKPKNFEVQYYTGRLYPPFSNYHDNALGHYYLQLPLYGRLLLKMLQGTKFDNIKLMGGVIVLLKENGTFEEFRIPQEINNTILTMDLTKYLKR